MRFRIDRTGVGVPIGCGASLVLFGLILLTPVGVFLVKVVGYVSLAAGLILVVSGIYYWMARFRRRNF